MIEFTNHEMIIIRSNAIRVFADSHAECGPFQLEKTGKMYKVTHRDGTVRRFKCLTKAVKMITGERAVHAREWEMKYPYTSVYHYSR